MLQFQEIYQAVQPHYNDVLTKESNPWLFFQTYYSLWWWQRSTFKGYINTKAPALGAKFNKMLDCLEFLKASDLFNQENCKTVVNNGNLQNLFTALAYLSRKQNLNPVYFNIASNHPHPLDLLKACSSLRKTRLFSPDNLTRISAHPNTKGLADALKQLKLKGLLTQSNFDLMIRYVEPKDLTFLLCSLHDAEILTTENRRSCIEHIHLNDLALAVEKLKYAGLLRQVYFHAVIEHANSSNLAYAFLELNKRDLLSYEYGKFITDHSKPHELAQALINLKTESIQSQMFIDMVARHSDPTNLSSLIIELKRFVFTKDSYERLSAYPVPKNLVGIFQQLSEGDILTQTHFNLVIAHPNPIELKNALTLLGERALLTETNFNFIAKHQHPRFFTSQVIYLQEASILSDENCNRLFVYRKLTQLRNIFPNLAKARILTQENFIAVLNHHQPVLLESALVWLKNAGMLSQSNFNIVIVFDHLKLLISAIAWLHQAHILTQENFDNLMTVNHSVLLTEEAIDLVWNIIPEDLRTQDNFQRLLISSETEAPMRPLTHLANQLRARRPISINHLQSTHTISVERSTSDSAYKLKQNYEHLLERPYFQNLIDEVNVLSDTLKSMAAKRYLLRLRQIEDTYIEPSSGLSVRELLTLAYIAIHDETKRQGSLIDAKSMLIEALYEIQRGGNLNAVGIDDGKVDSSICSSGAFNKILEKLIGIHADIEIYYISLAGASAKFPIILRSFALQFLSTLASPELASDYLEVRRLLDRLKEDTTIEPIWDKIKPQVQTVLWDEFKEAFNNNPKHHQFLSLLDNAIYQAIPDLSPIEAQLMTSGGYRRHQQCPFTTLSLWRDPHNFEDMHEESSALSTTTKI